MHMPLDVQNIGIIGKLGSGKTSLANYLAKEFLYRRISFADPMKQMAKEFFNVEKGDPLYRELMQKLGTDWFRSVDEDVWVKHLLGRTKGQKRLVIDDVRFPNEAAGLLGAGWKLLYLDCREEIRIERVTQRDGSFDPACLTHPSETGVDEIIQQYESQLYYIDAEVSADEVNEYVNNLFKYGVFDWEMP